jgi:hypothetical protein
MPAFAKHAYSLLMDVHSHEIVETAALWKIHAGKKVVLY